MDIKGQESLSQSLSDVAEDASIRFKEINCILDAAFQELTSLDIDFEDDEDDGYTDCLDTDCQF